MSYEQKPMTGSIFVNNSRNPKAPKLTGTATLEDGKKIRLALWVVTDESGTPRLDRDGKKYFSVKLSWPQEEQPPGEVELLTDETTVVDTLEVRGRQGIKCENGKVYGTNDEALAATAVPFVGTGEIVRITYEKAGRKLEFLGVEDANAI